MKVHVAPCGRLAGRLNPPSSKNYTTRYLLLSLLAAGRSRLVFPAISDDAVAMAGCMEALGARLEARGPEGAPVEFSIANAGRLASLDVEGIGARLLGGGEAPGGGAAEPPTLNPHNAGAVLRMLLGVGALLPEVHFITDHPDSLGRRPNRDLLDALEVIGVRWSPRTPEGTLPLTLRGGLGRIQAALDAQVCVPPRPEGRPRIPVSGDLSSQFVSAILFLAPLLGRDVEVVVIKGLKSAPLIETTLECLREAGAAVESSADRMRHVVRAAAPGAAPGYAAREWFVHGDWPGSAALLAAAAAVPGSEITVERLFDDQQGERRVVEILARMGCETRWEAPADASAPPSVALRAPAHAQLLRATEINGDLCTDAVPALYAAAALAAGQTRIFGIRNLQYKECDRIRRPLAELRRVFATAPRFQRPDGAPDDAALDTALRFEPADDPDEVLIQGRPEGFEGGIEVDGCGDHRVIMMLSIVALRCRLGLTIQGAEHVAKSYPRWFEDLRALGATAKELP